MAGAHPESAPPVAVQVGAAVSGPPGASAQSLDRACPALHAGPRRARPQRGHHPAEGARVQQLQPEGQGLPEVSGPLRDRNDRELHRLPGWRQHPEHSGTATTRGPFLGTAAPLPGSQPVTGRPLGPGAGTAAPRNLV